MSRNRPLDRHPQRSPLLTAFLVVLTIAGLAVTVVGTAYAVLADTPSNRQGNPLAGVAVAMGAWVGIFGGITAVLCMTVLVVRRRRDSKVGR